MLLYFVGKNNTKIDKLASCGLTNNFDKNVNLSVK